MTINKWDERFLEVASVVSSWSKDPGHKVGSVIVKNRNILSTGFNGFPTGMDDSEELYRDREYKITHVIHAELNSILNKGSNDINGSTIYCTFSPCLACSLAIIQARIIRVVSPVPTETRWKDQQTHAISQMEGAGIEVRQY